jgi:16S rRNA (cytidine1402-2'-O)-methyltransferase
MPGLLSVVATPIGNLEDITLRALRVLREADLVAAEDTRQTGKLLRFHGIQARTLSFHAHNTRSRLPQLISRLSAGARIALVTDAGTPGISDPGAELVQACRSHGITVEAVPGPSAPIAAAVVSGFPMTPLTVFGFPPVRSKDRTNWFLEAAKTLHTFTFFEAPHRIESTLQLCERYFGNRQICVARELTKIHEEAPVFWLRDLSEQRILAKGEFTIVVSPTPQPANEAPGPEPSDLTVLARFQEVSARLPDRSRREVLLQVAAELGLPRSTVYSAVERAKNRD